MASIAEVVEAHKLRRLARQIVELHHAAREGPDERTRRGIVGRPPRRRVVDTPGDPPSAREGGDPEQAALLEDLIGRTWLEKDLRRVEGLRLLELAYESAVLSSGFRIETSYLLDVGPSRCRNALRREADHAGPAEGHAAEALVLRAARGRRGGRLSRLARRRASS